MFSKIHGGAARRRVRYTALGLPGVTSKFTFCLALMGTLRHYFCFTGKVSFVRTFSYRMTFEILSSTFYIIYVWYLYAMFSINIMQKKSWYEKSSALTEVLSVYR